MHMGPWGFECGNPQQLPAQTLKNPPNSHVKPRVTQNHRGKLPNQLKINHLRAKNKFPETGTLVSLNSIELKVDSKKKTTTPGQKPGLRF
jgi:hypothetical protein